jgi:hypothetical protein
MKYLRPYFAAFIALCIAFSPQASFAVLKGATFNGTYAGTGVFDGITIDSSNQDVKLVRDAAAILAQRNSTTGQCFRVYNTFTDSSNYERGEICWTANVLTIASASAGTGTTRALNLNAPTGKLVNLQVNGVSIASVGANGLILATAAVANQLRTSQTTPPTCTTNCGTPGNVCVGTDTFMTCTMGTTPASGVLITFQGTWSSAPSCVVQMGLAGMVVGKQVLTAATTTTTVTLVTNGTAPATGDKYHIHCGGIA